MDGTLFNIEEFTDPALVRIMSGNTCRQCGNRFIRKCSYCHARPSKQTKTGFLKVKANQPACILFTNKNNAQ